MSRWMVRLLTPNRSAKAASARRRRSALGRPRSSANSSTLACTLRQGSSVGSWNT
jgi:hypothetical protein